MRRLCVFFALLTVFSVIFVSCGKQTECDKNWKIEYARFSPGTGRMIDSGGDAGIDVVTSGSGGIKVSAAKTSESRGAVATAVLTSKAKTPLDGLCVDISASGADFTRDENGRSEVVSILWSADRPLGLDAVAHVDHTATNGIRNMAPPTKALCITLNNTYTVYDGTKTASNVMITLIDGDFTDASDDRLGYRWSFTARNNLIQSPNTDGTGIQRSFEKVDMSDGLRVEVRADDDHGYIISVNGRDYYSAEDIAYYPNNVKDCMSSDSMTAQRDDIDLSALIGYEGYVSVGFVGTLDENLPYEFTLEKVNGVAASEWEG